MRVAAVCSKTRYCWIASPTRRRNGSATAEHRVRKQLRSKSHFALLVLKHARNWSYENLEREVRTNLDL